MIKIIKLDIDTDEIDDEELEDVNKAITDTLEQWGHSVSIEYIETGK